MVPYQVSAIERLKTIVGIATLGLLAPFLVDFRNETDEIATNNQNEEVPQTTQMTVNDKGEEDFNVNSRIKDRSVRFVFSSRIGMLDRKCLDWMIVVLTIQMSERSTGNVVQGLSQSTWRV